MVPKLIQNYGAKINPNHLCAFEMVPYINDPTMVPKSIQNYTRIIPNSPKFLKN
jgi:hypothetical protein